jgi:phosphohistidine swiveling domain-containing protein
MERISLSLTAQEILAVYFANPDQKFYVNELIRKTGKYPNSIQQALKSLEKQKILSASRLGRLKLHFLNRSNPLLDQIRAIVEKGGRRKTEDYLKEPEWVKVVNRVNEIPYVYQVFEGERDNLRKVLGLRFENFWYNGLTGGVYYYKEHLRKGGEIILEKTKRDKNFAKNIADQCLKQGEEFVKKTKIVLRLDLVNLSKKEIYKFLKGRVAEFSQFANFLFIPLSIESILEGQIEESLKSLGVSPSKMGQVKRRLIEPTSFIQEEQTRQLELASLVKEFGWNIQARKALAALTADFCWLPMYTLMAKPFDEQYFKNGVEDILKKVPSPAREISKLQAKELVKAKELGQLLAKLKADQYLRDLINLFQSYIMLRTYRVNVFRRFNFFHLPLLYEIAQRMVLSEKEIKFLTYGEMLSWLKHGYGQQFGYSYETFKKEIAKRISGWAILMWRGRIKIIVGVKDILEATEQYKIIAPTSSMQRIVKGNPACRGHAIGRVKIVRNLKELDKVDKGDILVTKMTTPDYMMAIHKAAAIVTDEGGVTCHAAIVSREFNLPCIVGTKNATQILADNDLVEVDANEGVVRVVEAVEVDENVREIYGKTAFKGKVRGAARVVLDASDFPKVCEGDILIAPQTTPEYLSSLYKVKGFVVDEESITSHAMLYAKALRLPALIGTQFARQVIQDGEIVELDATIGVLKRIEKLPES